MKYAPRKVYIKESGGYVELSYTDFCRRRQADKGYMDKLFIPVQGCLLEVVREQYADFYRDRERWRYLQKLDAKNRLLSLDGFTDSEGNPLDFITDEAVDIAETVVNAVMVDRLKAALPLLSDSEQELIQAIFFDGLSEREVGARLGITQSVVNKRKARILIKLRKYEFNFYQIAAMEHCTASAIQKSVAIAKEKVKAEIEEISPTVTDTARKRNLFFICVGLAALHTLTFFRGSKSIFKEVNAYVQRKQRHRPKGGKPCRSYRQSTPKRSFMNRLRNHPLWWTALSRQAYRCSAAHRR